MALITLTPENVALNAFTAIQAPAAVDATDGMRIDYSERDDKILLLIENTSADTAYDFTIKAGNGIQGTYDLAQADIAAGASYVAVLESGKFKNVSGTYSGYVYVTAQNAAIKVSAYKLP